MKNRKNISFASPHSLAGIDCGAPVLLALSGGADSCALLHLLVEDSREKGYALHVAHFNHMIRGEEADRDERFCLSLAKKYGLPCHVGRADIPSLAKASGRGIENEARYRRYAFFEDVMEQYGIPLLVTAHHADDLIESILLHMLRGSGVSGLKGITKTRPLGGGSTLVRPLLETDKASILEFCKENNIGFVTDTTNDDTGYARNAIRKNVTPALYELQPSLTSVFARLSQSAEDADDFLNASAEELLENCEGGLPISKINNSHRALASRALAIEFSRHSEATLEHVHVRSLLELARKAEAHASISLPGKMTAVIEYDKLIFKKEEQKTEDEPFSFPFFVGKKNISRLVSVKIEKDPKDECECDSVFIDIRSELVENGAILRSRKEGDTVQVGKMNKKVKKLISEKRIPLSKRDRLPILEADGEILWIPCVAPCDRVKRDKIKQGESFYRITVRFEED